MESKYSQVFEDIMTLKDKFGEPPLKGETLQVSPLKTVSSGSYLALTNFNIDISINIPYIPLKGV